MKRELYLPVTLLIMGTLFIPCIQTSLIRDALRVADLRAGRLIAQSMAVRLEKAHRENDDISLQDAVQALAQATGVIYAAVYDTEGKVLAHTDPSQLGKTSHSANHRRGDPVIWMQSLRTQATTWGTLVISLSGKTRGKQTSQHVWLLTIQLITVGLAGMYFWRYGRRIQFEQTRALESIHYKHLQVEKELNSLRTLRNASEATWSSSLREALERVSQPTLFLDACQRIVGFNSLAMRRLGVFEGSLQGRSWNELPALAEIGPAIEQSLHQPNHSISVQIHDQSAILRTESPSLGTWIHWN
jgi:uncharacterized membrane protein affecting hemolysin expression